MNTLKAQEVFAVGKWNGMTFQLHDLRAMVDSFTRLKGMHKPPLKIGHTSQQTLAQHQHALGWVSNLYLKGDKLLADFEAVPDVVMQAIKNKLYRSVSIEMLMDVKYKGELLPFVVDAVALLGADLPAVNTLEDLNAYMSRGGAFTAGRRAAFSAVAGNIATGETQMDDKAINDKVEAAVKAALGVHESALRAEFATARQTDANRIKELEGQVATFAAQEQQKKVTDKRTQVVATLEGLTAGGHMTPAQRESFTTLLGVNDDTRVMLVDVPALVASFGVESKTDATGKVCFTKKADSKDEHKGAVLTYEQAADKVNKRANELVTANKLTYTAAVEQVLGADNDLAVVYARGPLASTR